MEDYDPALGFRCGGGMGNLPVVPFAGTGEEGSEPGLTLKIEFIREACVCAASANFPGEKSRAEKREKWQL